MLIKLVPLLCLALAIFHSTSATATWPVNGQGDGQTGNSNHVYSDSDSFNFGSIPGYTQYVQNVDTQDMARQPMGAEYLSSQITQPAQHKTNFGTKGTGQVIGQVTRNQPQQTQQQQTDQQQLSGYSVYDSNPDQFINPVYMDPAVNVPTANATESKGKNKFRSIFPWNWPIFNPSSKDQIDQQPAQSAPKRAWAAIIPQRAVVPARQQYCQCYYPYQPYPTYQTYTGQVEVQPITGSNVRPVAPSDDLQGLGSESIVKTVPAPQQTANVQSHHTLAMQSQQQQQPANGQVQYAPTGSNDQLTVQQQQQVAPSQQVPYQPYPSNGNTFTGSNSQTLPANTNFQSPPSDTVQNGQANN